MLIHTGTVKASAGLYVRSTPNGSIVGKLNYGASIQGQGELVLAGNYRWMQITSPIAGWVASEFLNYTSEEQNGEPTPAEKIYIKMSPTGTEYTYTLVEG